MQPKDVSLFTIGGERAPPSAGRAHACDGEGAAPGSYAYICRIHPFMHGTLVVTS